MRTATLLKFSALSAVVILAGCQSATNRVVENAIEQETGGNAEVNADGTMRIETSESTLDIGSGTLPENWPSDVPQYPGSTVTFSGAQNPATGAPGMAASFVTTDDAAAVVASYKTTLESNGWTMTSTMQSGTMNILGASKGAANLAISIIDGGDQTTITVSIETE